MSSQDAISTYALIGCSNKKVPIAMPAWSMYLGSTFATFAAYSRLENLRRFILSGKHGLLDPYVVIEPYDFDLEASNDATQREWGDRVAAQIKETIPGPARLVFMAGPVYRDRVIDILSADADRYETRILTIEKARQLVDAHYRGCGVHS